MRLEGWPYHLLSYLKQRFPSSQVAILAAVVLCVRDVDYEFHTLGTISLLFVSYFLALRVNDDIDDFEFDQRAAKHVLARPELEALWVLILCIGIVLSLEFAWVSTILFGSAVTLPAIARILKPRFVLGSVQGRNESGSFIGNITIFFLIEGSVVLIAMFAVFTKTESDIRSPDLKMSLLCLLVCSWFFCWKFGRIFRIENWRPYGLSDRGVALLLVCVPLIILVCEIQIAKLGFLAFVVLLGVTIPFVFASARMAQVGIRPRAGTPLYFMCFSLVPASILVVLTCKLVEL